VPPRAAEIEATCIQFFTKQPNRWAERVLKEDDIAGYRKGIGEGRVTFACAHDSYLINLATADEALRDRSYASFCGELRRANELGLQGVVTHPGNATDGDVERGLAQNAGLVALALKEVGGQTRVYLETTAGAGSVLGSTFEELARMIEMIPEEVTDRVGVCIDTCHIYSAGYDIRDDYDGVMARFDEVIGLDRLAVIHLNDSRHPLGSKKDRHQHIGEGELGDEPFRRIMNDSRLENVPKILETPKEDDHAANDRRNLARLRSLYA